MGHKAFLGFAVGAFVIGFINVTGNIILAAVGARGSAVVFGQVGLLWCVLAGLSVLVGRTVKSLNERLERIEPAQPGRPAGGVVQASGT